MDLENFYNSLLVKNGFSEITVNGYRKVLLKFFKEIGTLTINEEIINGYIAKMRTNGYSYSHIVNTSVALERYTGFIGSPVKLGRPRKPKQLIKNVLTEGEVARILAVTKNKREQAILAILVYTGIRNKELCSLKVEDLDFDNQFLRVICGKGSKDRVVYFSKECSKILIEYLGEYKRDDKQFLFTTLVLRRQYNGWVLRKLVKVVSKRARVKKRVYPHLFRHSFACNLLNRGANIMTIQSLMGHNDVRTTLIYAHSTPQRIRQEYDFYMPSFI